MKSVTVKLSVPNEDLCRFIKDPEDKEISHVECILPFNEIAKLRVGNANVRPPDRKRRPFKAMMDTVEHDPKLFHIKNRGITYICTSVNFDGDNQTLTIEIPDPSELKKHKDTDGMRYGIADGGHTFQVIKNVIEQEKDYENIPDWKLPNARVHFLVIKDIEPINEIVEALNTSLQVKQHTLDEYQNKFQSLKNALEQAGFDPDLVSFKENEMDKEWNVIEVIQRLACFLKDKWVSKQPINMYKSKNKALRLFTNEKTRPEFNQLSDVIVDCLTLPEFLENRFSKGGIVPAKSLAKLKAVKLRKKTYTRPGTEYPSDHKFDMAALLPMAAGFRELLYKPTDEHDKYEWRFDYREVFDRCATQLYDLLVEHSGKVYTSSQLASDPEYWSGCASIISRAERDMLDERGTLTIRKPKVVKPVDTEKEKEYSQVEEPEVKSVIRARKPQIEDEVKQAEEAETEE